MTNRAAIALAAVLAAALFGGMFWWQGEGPGGRIPNPPPPVAAAAPVAPAPAPAPAPASAPAIQHPVPAVAASGSELVPDFEAALVELFGAPTAAGLLRTEDFAHRFVATIDNLGRESAPSGVWPVQPAKGRFLAADTASGQVVQADNALRYAPYVILLEQVDLRKAVRVYAQHYPALQRAYEQLGLPQPYFNDRFIAVLDQLLATPEVPAPVHVHLPTIVGPAPTRPWLLYEFDDPALRSLSAGQRILLRMGTVNERRVKARLAELRGLLAADNTGA